ncbi:MAG: hypothetical protein E6Y39_03750, partial [Clostridium butyricum]|nr:hypothetical protein [Clostridium butyricum]
GKMAVGAVTNGFESIVRQKLNGQDIDWGTVALDGGIGGLTAGAFHYGGKAVDSASPYVKKAFNKVSSKLSENAKYARLALENVNSKANKSVVLGSNFGNVSKKVDDFVDEFKNVKNIAKLSNTEIKGEKVFGPYYDEAKRLFNEDPDYFPDPDVCIMTQGKDLDKMRKDYNKLSNSNKLSKGHHRQGLAFGGKNIESNIVKTGESTINRSKLTKAQQEQYSNPNNGYTSNKNFKIAKITEDDKGTLIKNGINYKFGLNDRHTRATNFQNKVLKWQREAGIRIESSKGK